MKVDRRNRKRFEKELERISSMSIRVGAVGEHSPKKRKKEKKKKSASNPDTISNADLLKIHEFGLGTNPARAPIGKTFANQGNLDELKATLSRLMLIAYQPSTSKFNADLIGNGMAEKIKALVKATISARLDPPVKSETQAKKFKQGTIPLIDTRELFRSIETDFILKK